MHAVQQGRSTATLMLTLAQNESLDKSKKVKFGLKESARNGIIFTNGKNMDINTISRINSLEVIDKEANVIKAVFDLYINGLVIRE